MVKKISILLLLVVSTMAAIAASNTEQIRELTTQLQKMQIVDATRKGYSEPSDIARRKRISELSAQIYKLQQAQVNDLKLKMNTMEQDHVQLLENLKTCSVSKAKTITGMNYVLGLENGLCKYQMSFGTKNIIICNFPTAVAKRYAQESINSIKNGTESTFLENATTQYCSMQSK